MFFSFQELYIKKIFRLNYATNVEKHSIEGVRQVRAESSNWFRRYRGCRFKKHSLEKTTF